MLNIYISSNADSMKYYLNKTSSTYLLAINYLRKGVVIYYSLTFAN